MAKQSKVKTSPKQPNPFEPKKEAKKTNVYPSKRAGSIFETSKEDTHDEPREWAEDHEEKGETEEQIEDEMRAGETQADMYTEEGRHVLTDDEDEESLWEEAWSQGASGKGQAGKSSEQPTRAAGKVKDTLKGKKRK